MLKVSDTGEVRLTRGDTARLSVSISNNGEDYDIADGLLTMTVKKNLKKDEFLFQKNIKGTNIFYIKPEDTSPASFGNYFYDVQLTTAGNDVYTVIEPTLFEITSEATV